MTTLAVRYFLPQIIPLKMFYRENKAIISMVGNISFFVSGYQIIQEKYPQVS